MIRRPSILASLLALVAGASFGGMAAPLAITAAPDATPPILGIGRGSGRTKRKVEGAPRGSGRRRKNPFRGTTYARVIGVSSHIS